MSSVSIFLQCSAALWALQDNYSGTAKWQAQSDKLDLCMLIMRWVRYGDGERSCMACLELFKVSSDVALQDVGLLGQQLCLAQV